MLRTFIMLLEENNSKPDVKRVRAGKSVPQPDAGQRVPAHICSLVLVPLLCSLVCAHALRTLLLWLMLHWCEHHQVPSPTSSKSGNQGCVQCGPQRGCLLRAGPWSSAGV